MHGILRGQSFQLFLDFFSGVCFWEPTSRGIMSHSSGLRSQRATTLLASDCKAPLVLAAMAPEDVAGSETIFRDLILN